MGADLAAHEALAVLADAISEVFGEADRRYAVEVLAAIKDRGAVLCEIDALTRQADALRSLVIDLRSEAENLNYGPQHLNAEVAYGYSLGWSRCADAILTRHGLAPCTACGDLGVVAAEGMNGWCPRCSEAES